MFCWHVLLPIFMPIFLPYALAAATTLGLPVAAQAAYPEKPITFVVPFAAASATDQLARALGQ